jgi:tRNA pseudouridine13 synthase
MKLRQVPEDFLVEEIAKFKIQKSGKFKLYSLEKQGLETFSLIRYLSGQNNIPSSKFGIAGLKDKHASTKQYFTLPTEYKIKTSVEKNFKITELGYVDKAIGIGDLFGNRFEVTVRDIRKEELQSITERIEIVKRLGVPNYFDSQRFGSCINGEFIIKHVMKKDYETAVKLYLTAYSRHENKKVKDEKRMLRENWGKIESLNLKNKHLARIIDEYAKTKDWLSAYKKIPANIRELFVSAYQSFLWNECVKMLLEEKKVQTVKYRIGELLFPDEAVNVPERFTTISPNMKPSDSEKSIIEGVLQKEGLCLDDFEIKKTGHFFGKYERKVMIRIDDLNVTEPRADELNKNKCKLAISFTLPRGSYATIVTKGIFLR